MQGLAGQRAAAAGREGAGARPAEADTAIFYSISNCQRGLAGISFGNFLIKRVVELLAAELRSLQGVRDAVAGPGVSPLAGSAAGRRRRLGSLDR